MNCNYHTLRLYELGSTTGCNSIFDCGSNLCKWQPTHFRFSNCNSAIFFCVHKFIHSFITMKWRAIVQFVVVKYYVLYYRYWWYWVLSVWRLVYPVGLSAGDCLSGWQFLVIHPSVQRQKRLCVWFSCCRPKHIFWRFTFRTYIFCRFARCGPVGNSSQFYDSFFFVVFVFLLFIHVLLYIFEVVMPNMA